MAVWAMPGVRMVASAFPSVPTLSLGLRAWTRFHFGDQPEVACGSPGEARTREIEIGIGAISAGVHAITLGTARQVAPFHDNIIGTFADMRFRKRRYPV